MVRSRFRVPHDRRAVRNDAAFAQAGELRVAQAELGAQHRGRVLADPRHTRLGTFGHLRQLHRDCRERAPARLTPSVRGISTSMCRAATCGSAITSGAWLLGPATMPASVSSCAATSFVRCDAHASTAGRISVSRCGPNPRASRTADRLPLGMADQLGEVEELVLAHDLHDDVAVGGAEAFADHFERLVGFGPHARATRSW